MNLSWQKTKKILLNKNSRWRQKRFSQFKNSKNDSSSKISFFCIFFVKNPTFIEQIFLLKLQNG
jgi:hypothetical protein